MSTTNRTWVPAAATGGATKTSAGGNVTAGRHPRQPAGPRALAGVTRVTARGARRENGPPATATTTARAGRPTRRRPEAAGPRRPARPLGRRRRPVAVTTAARHGNLPPRTTPRPTTRLWISPRAAATRRATTPLRSSLRPTTAPWTTPGAAGSPG